MSPDKGPTPSLELHVNVFTQLSILLTREFQIAPKLSCRHGKRYTYIPVVEKTKWHNFFEPQVRNNTAV